MNSTRWATLIAGVAVGAAACGAGGAGTAAPANVANINAAAAVSAASGNVAIKTRHVSPYGTILTASNGRTLYLFTDDHKGSSSCNGACATEWPPVLVSKGGKVSGVSGLGTIKRSNGQLQAALRGHALYRFSGDTAAGQVKGQGVEGDWFVATPSGASHAKPAAPKPKPTATKSSPPAGGGYGY
jgi:predicted lipoprotein with Yx(FWY)xxD motif